MLLPCHAAVLGRYGQAEGILALALLFFVCSTDIPANRRLADLLLQELLVLLVLLGVLLQELAQARVELIVALLTAVDLALLRSRLRPIEHVAVACGIEANVGPIPALIDATRAFLHHSMLILSEAGTRCLTPGQIHWRESLVLLRRAHLSLLTSAKLCTEATETIRYVNTLVFVLVIFRLATAAWHLVHVQWVDPLAEQASPVVGGAVDDVWVRVACRSRLTDVTLLLVTGRVSLSDLPSDLTSLHVRAVT